LYRKYFGDISGFKGDKKIEEDFVDIENIDYKV